MTWAIVFTIAFAGRLKTKLYIPAVLILAVLPDLDLLVENYVGHHTLTHSFLFWIVLLFPFLAVYRLSFIPYLVAVVQHFAFGDFLIGRVMLFWPFSRSFFGLKIPMMSSLDVGLEITGLLLAAIILFYNGDLKRLLSQHKSNILMFLPFLAVGASMLFSGVDIPIFPLITHLWESPLFAIIVLAHLALLSFLGSSALQGLRKYWTDIK